MKPLGEVLTSTSEWFRGRGIPSARLDAELIVGHVLGLDRVKVYLNFDRPLSDEELERIRVLVRRRGAREPLAWVLGEKDFLDHTFLVHPHTLVPRPDTETLVERALAWIDTSPCFVADVGCGTGCVGLSLALARPELRLYALDRSEAALANTRANVERFGLGARVAVRPSDLLSGVPAARPLDWVVSNPPYIPAGEIAGLAPELHVEPRLALDGGPDGLDTIRRLVDEAASRARQGLLLEVGRGQSGLVAGLMEAAGFTTEVWPDLAGTPRVVGGRKRAT